MYAAISGLKTHMQKLNVIGNNIANVNTYGYKSGRTIFKEGLYTTLSGGSNGTTTTGGTNPAQIGYGVETGSIGINMTTGTYSPTGYSTDCMIDGDGFFLVGNKDVKIDPDNPESLKNLTLTRVGDFSFSADGYLTDGNGNVVYGFITVEDEDAEGGTSVSDQLVPIRLPMMSSTVEEDAAGNIVTTYELKFPTAEDGVALTDQVSEDDDNPYTRVSLDSITIDGTTGKVTGITKDTDEVIVIGYIAIGNVTNPSGVSHESGPYYKALDGAGDLTVGLLGGIANDLGITHVNGSLSEAGEDGLMGMAIGSAGTTKLITGGLEASTTDLATEISEMITTQRGYQANTRIITVTDSMLEELVNIKR